METLDDRNLMADLVFDTFNTAMTVHGKLFEKLKSKGFVTIAEYYAIAYATGCPDPAIYMYGGDYPPVYHAYGWDNLFYSKVEETSDKRWVLKMPEIILLKVKENEK